MAVLHHRDHDHHGMISFVPDENAESNDENDDDEMKGETKLVSSSSAAAPSSSAQQSEEDNQKNTTPAKHESLPALPTRTPTPTPSFVHRYKEKRYFFSHSIRICPFTFFYGDSINLLLTSSARISVVNLSWTIFSEESVVTTIATITTIAATVIGLALIMWQVRSRSNR